MREIDLLPVSVEGWFDLAGVQRFVPSKGFKEEAIRTYKAAKELLGDRLRSGYYKTDIENLKDKLAEFEIWIQRTREL